MESRYDKASFLKPEDKYRINPIVHKWPENYQTMVRALRAYGYGGTVTNVPFENGWVANPENLKTFQTIVNELEKEGLSFWIYDEVGYPSGTGNRQALKGHPELEAKGFYMLRRAAYEEERHVSFHIDDETDKIIWAAKYPIVAEPIWDNYVPYDRMQPVEFSETSLECDLGKMETLFIFCVKSAYEGSHCTHNASNFDRYVNILEPKAVQRFIDVAFEPLVAAFPDALKKAQYIFTDEPSLQVGYAREYETWSYALAPYSENLFEEFEKEYGYSLLPYLPLLFEGDLEKAAPVRIQFYSLLGKLLAASYTRQLTEWCEAHGCGFSGHYLGDEYMAWHVKDYGNYVEMLKAASYPGIDLLQCYPEGYRYTTGKHGQMAARKKGSNGLMVELCPFDGVEEFNAAPLDNSCAIAGLLYSGGVRIVNSYIPVDYSDYDDSLSKKDKAVATYSPESPDLNGAQSLYLNNYVGRLGYMLDGLMNDCNTFIYYGLEDMQAKTRPHHSGSADPKGDIDNTTYPLLKRVYESGFDFYFADREDMAEALETLKKGTPAISGNEVKTVIVPGMDVIHSDTLDALEALQKAGVKVFFNGKYPAIGTDAGADTLARCKQFALVSEAEIIAHLAALETRFTARTDDAVLIKSRYIKDGAELYFLCNNSRRDADVSLHHAEYETATLYDPVDGTVRPISLDKTVNIPALRSAFVLFE